MLTLASASLAHAMALVLRLVFFVTSLGSAVLMLTGRCRGRSTGEGASGESVAAATKRPLVLALVASLSLMASAALATDASCRLPLLAAATVAIVMTGVFGRLLPAMVCADVAPAVLGIVGVGMTLSVRVGASSSYKFIAFVAAGLLVTMPVSYLICRRGLLRRLTAHPAIMLALALGLLLLPLVPGLGVSVNGSRSWVNLRLVQVQPSELAKLALVCGLSGFCAINAERLGRRGTARGVIAQGFVALASCALTLLLQKDLGCLLVILVVVTVVLAATSGKAWPAYVLAAIAVLVVGCFVGNALFSHVQVRISLWLHPEAADPAAEGYQYLHAMASIGRGGILGCGIGGGGAWKSVPVVESDYVACLLVEELGLAGLAVVALYFVAIARHAARVLRAHVSAASFEATLVGGICALLVVEALVNLAGVLNLLPMTGIVLPLVSAGGSSMVATSMALGMLAAAEECLPAVQGVEGGQGTAAAFAAATRSLALPLLFAALLPLALVACLCKAGAVEQSHEGLGLFGTATREVVAGDILTSDGVVLATNAEDGSRSYPCETLASHLVGQIDAYGDFAASSLNGLVTGEDPEGPLSSAVGNALALSRQGSDVRLTLDSQVQAASEQALSGCSGAVVCIDAQTGEVVALASSDPVNLANPGDGGSYFARATDALYSPGSTFKLVTLAAALESGSYMAKTTVDASSPLSIEGGLITNFNGVDAGAVTLADATTRSLNTAYARVYQSLGGEAIQHTAEAFGINRELGTAAQLRLAASTLDFSALSEWEAAWAACGQAVSANGPQVSVVQMASIMQGICNGGVVVEPHVVDGEAASSQAISADAAQGVVDILKGAGETLEGGVSVFGKTGTSQTSDSSSDAWWIGCVEQDGEARYVVAVVVDGGGLGASVAKPKGISVLEAAIAAAA